MIDLRMFTYARNSRKIGDSKNSAGMYEYKNMVFDVISDNFCSLLITQENDVKK